MTLGKSSKGGHHFDKSSRAGGAKQSFVVASNKNKNKRVAKRPPSLMDMSNDGGDTIMGGVQDFLSDNDDPMKDDDGDSSNFNQDDSDN